MQQEPKLALANSLFILDLDFYFNKQFFKLSVFLLLVNKLDKWGSLHLLIKNFKYALENFTRTH